jgi:hypothetical protein
MGFLIIGFGIFGWMIYKPFKKVIKRGRKASKRLKKFKSLSK